MKNSRIQIKFPGFQIQVSKFPENLFAINTSISFRQVSKKPSKLVIWGKSKNLVSLAIVDSIQVSRFPKILQKKFQVSNWLNLLGYWVPSQVSKFPTAPPPLHGG